MKRKTAQHFKNKTIYITGSASGLGLETAKQLSQLPVTLVLLDKIDLDETVTTIKRSNSSQNSIIVHEKIDITDGKSLKKTVDKLAVQYPPDFCMHFAGITGLWLFDEMTQEQFERVLQVNLFGTRNWLSAIRPYLYRDSQVMVTASIASFIGSYGYASYSASKFAVWGMIQSIRSEWQPLGIKLSVFAPPHIDTPLTETEKGTMNTVGLLLKKNAGKLDKTDAINYLLDCMAKQKFLIIPGVMANFVNLQLRLLPQSIINKYTDLQIRVLQKIMK